MLWKLMARIPLKVRKASAKYLPSAGQTVQSNAQMTYLNLTVELPYRPHL